MYLAKDITSKWVKKFAWLPLWFYDGHYRIVVWLQSYYVWRYWQNGWVNDEYSLVEPKDYYKRW